MHNHALMLLACFIVFVTGNAQVSPSWLEDIKAEMSWSHPIVISNPTGGYTAIWEEIGDKPSEMPGFPPRNYFYRMIDAGGKTVVSKGEFEFWRLSTTPNYYAVLFNSKALLWINTDSLLILAWKWFFSGVKIDRVIVNAKGEIVDGPDSALEAGVGEDAVLVKDRKGRVTAFDWGAGLGAMSVYPEFRKVTKMPRQDWKDFFSKYPSDVFTFRSPLMCMITSEDKFWSVAGWVGEKRRAARGVRGTFLVGRTKDSMSWQIWMVI